jgi:hypothetical protein
MNKKLYSDDFDMSFEDKKGFFKKKRIATGSVIECPITENIESENENEYLSDGSSSNFSFRMKKMSLDLSKLIDKAEPSMEESSTGGRAAYKYKINISETIEEEDDEKDLQDAGLISEEIHLK